MTLSAKLDEKDNRGNTVLHLACDNGNAEIVKKILLEKICYDRTALHVACIKGYTEIVKLLLAEDGASPDEKDKYGFTELDYSCDLGHTEIVKLLLSKTIFMKKHKIHIDESVKKKNWAIVRLFLEKILEENDLKIFIEYIFLFA